MLVLPAKPAAPIGHVSEQYQKVFLHIRLSRLHTLLFQIEFLISKFWPRLKFMFSLHCLREPTHALHSFSLQVGYTHFLKSLLATE